MPLTQTNSLRDRPSDGPIDPPETNPAPVDALSICGPCSLRFCLDEGLAIKSAMHCSKSAEPPVIYSTFITGLLLITQVQWCPFHKTVVALAFQLITRWKHSIRLCLSWARGRNPQSPRLSMFFLRHWAHVWISLAHVYWIKHTCHQYKPKKCLCGFLVLTFVGWHSLSIIAEQSKRTIWGGWYTYLL